MLLVTKDKVLTLFVGLLVAAFWSQVMPHSHFVAVRAERHARALRLGFVVPRKIGVAHVEVVSQLAPRFKAIAKSIVTHAAHCEALDAPVHGAKRAAGAAHAAGFINDSQLDKAREVHKIRDRAVHRWSDLFVEKKTFGPCIAVGGGSQSGKDAKIRKLEDRIVEANEAWILLNEVAETEEARLRGVIAKLELQLLLLSPLAVSDLFGGEFTKDLDPSPMMVAN
jgi:hypothetical protein